MLEQQNEGRGQAITNLLSEEDKALSGDHSVTIGIEYEGRVLSEVDGVMATKKLLEKAGKSM
jgi:hypothetical protein